MDEPLDNQEAQKLVREILRSGTVFFTPHAQRAMADDRLTAVDVENVLRAGWVEMAEYESREWRYRVRTNRIAAIVALDSEVELTIITVWRF
jgi:hypothetical protein